MGAAVSTLLSYLLIFLVRAVHTRSMLPVMNHKKFYAANGKA